MQPTLAPRHRAAGIAVRAPAAEGAGSVGTERVVPAHAGLAVGGAALVDVWGRKE